MGKPAPSFRGGEGPPLVLLHAGWTCWRLWAPMLPFLTEHFSVFAPTMPGHFGGPPLDFKRPLTLAALVDGVERLIDDAGFDQFAVIGNSIGGWGALELARRGRATQVVAIGPMGMQSHRSARLIERYATAGNLAARAARPMLPAAARVPALRKQLLRDFGTHGDRVAADVARDVMEAFANIDVHGLFNAVRTEVGVMPNIDAPWEIDTPVQLIWGDRDWLARRGDMRRYMEALPNARFVAIPGAGHSPELDEPERTWNVIRPFLTAPARVTT